MDRFEPIFEALNATGVRYVIDVAMLTEIQQLLAEETEIAADDRGSTR